MKMMICRRGSGTKVKPLMFVPYLIKTRSFTTVYEARIHRPGQLIFSSWFLSWYYSIFLCGFFWWYQFIFYFVIFLLISTRGWGPKMDKKKFFKEIVAVIIALILIWISFIIQIIKFISKCISFIIKSIKFIAKGILFIITRIFLIFGGIDNLVQSIKQTWM